MSWEVERQKLAFLHQKGWIANQFKVKNNLSAILKSKYRHITQANRQQCSMGATPIHHKSNEHSRVSKPLTAPHKIRHNAQMFEQHTNKREDDGLARVIEAKHNNFKTTLNNKRQLLFLKPYAKNRASWMSMGEKKAEIYREISNADQINLSCSLQLSGPIQYHTEYGVTSPNDKHNVKQRCLQKRKSLNVLKSKLKNRIQLSFYQSKMRNYKQSNDTPLI